MSGASNTNQMSECVKRVAYKLKMAIAEFTALIPSSDSTSFHLQFVEDGSRLAIIAPLLTC